jgi:hypothetical protein
MSHRAFLLRGTATTAAVALLTVTPAACSPAEEPSNPDEKAATVVEMTAIPSESTIEVVIDRDAGGRPTGLSVHPPSAVVCTHPKKYCAPMGSWRVRGGLQAGESVRVTPLEPNPDDPTPEELRIPEFTLDGDRETYAYTIPEDFARLDPPPGKVFVSSFYAVELTWGDGNLIVLDPRVIIDRTR